VCARLYPFDPSIINDYFLESAYFPVLFRNFIVIIREVDIFSTALYRNVLKRE
jgi:hypothetical protein